MSTFQSESELSAREVIAESSGLRLVLTDGREFEVPYAGWPSLATATTQQRSNFRLIGGGEGIHWPDIDEDLSVAGLYRDFCLQAGSPLSEVPQLIAELYKVTRRLGNLFDKRPFTPDGHLVGSIGEVVAEFIYDLKLESCSMPQIDAKTRDGQTVQIKLTGEQGKSYGLRWANGNNVVAPDLLICLKLTPTGFEEVYAGSFPIDLLVDRPNSSNGQLAISVSRLKARNPSSIPRIRSLQDFNLLFETELGAAA